MRKAIQPIAETTPGLIKSPALDALSFVRKNEKGGGYIYWADVPKGERYGEDCDTGIRLAEEFIAFVGKYHNAGNASLLGSIMIDMEANGATRGHRIGFMNTINRYAMAGGYLSQLPEKPSAGETMRATIAALHADWRTLNVIASTLDEAESEAADNALAKSFEVGRQIMAIRSMTLPDFAAKLLVDTGNGDLPVDPSLIEEAKGIVARAEADHRPDGAIRLDNLLSQVAAILRDEPELKIARVVVNGHGVHTFHKIPGYEPKDPLLDAIRTYLDGVKHLDSLKDQITPQEEEAIVQETYGEPMTSLLTWDRPAGSLDGAIEALKLMEAEEVFVDDIGPPMLRAVLRYLENLEGMVA